MRIAIAQLNPIVGDLAGNERKIADAIAAAAKAGADLVVTPELSVCGYPPRDLLRKERFVREVQAVVRRLAERCTQVAALVGFVRPTPGGEGRPLQNAAALLAGGEVRSVHVKTLLPTYDVFDESRYFQPGDPPQCLKLDGRTIGVSVCEDLWDAISLGRQLYHEDPIERLVGQGAELIVNMAASPYEMHKAPKREELFRRRAEAYGLPVVYANQVGGNDELIFDGSSCVVGPDGRLLGRARSFDEDLLIVDLDAAAPARVEPLEDPVRRLRGAIQLGLRDYVRKCGFQRVVLGLSGGIDSAVVAVLAADALGAENVLCLAMPSRYSSDHSLADARQLAKNLAAPLEEVGIEPMHRAFEGALSGLLAGGQAEVAEENVQARARGVIVMALSNAHGHLALATGNKSEMSVGYCTLYGDMAGGLAPIGDVLKTDVYRIARDVNAQAGYERIPGNILSKAPSAELKPGQTDQDKLPPYDLLDGILERYIEGDLTPEQIVAEGFDPAVVQRVTRMVDAAEFKRKQAAPVLKVSGRAFGTGRRMPIVQRYVPAEDR